MDVSSTSVSKQQPLSDSEVKVQGNSNKADEICSNLPERHTSSTSPAPALAPEKKKKRNGCPGVRVVGSRIYDSQNGKTCHQCRQKTMDIVASCKNEEKEKQCNVKYCHKCLLNRYGEKTEEVEALKEWVCPRCRGICNCSFCRKKNGQQPTGILTHTAKSIGFASVSEMLIVNGSDVQLLKESTCGIKRKGKENSGLEENIKKVKEGDVIDNGVLISKKRKRKSTKGNEGIHKDECHDDNSKISISSSSVAEIPLLPQGSELKSVANIELQPEEIGHALQLLEFCAAFKEILELKKDESEYILRELIRGGGGCIGRSSPVAQFLVRLLTLIDTDSGERSNVINHRLSHKTSWLLALHRCISTSTFLPGKLKFDQFDGGVDSFKSLNSVERLTLVNFVCDEVLCTSKVRNWMEEQQLKCNEEVKETKEKIAAAKQKEKQLKQKMKDELAEAINAKNGVPLSVSEHTTIISQFKVQTDQVRAEILEAKKLLCSEKQHCSSVRRKPVFMDNEGLIFWRLKGCGNESNIILQEVSLLDELDVHEKWFTYEEGEQMDKVKKYISFKTILEEYSTHYQIEDSTDENPSTQFDRACDFYLDFPTIND
ncbi:uncharacterized protein LOC124924980 [Impatiens glandulifera]|uniref:uncharacterized protein LOC124924980 n=1 Tax=Impatiens glandulifera TaxID=253017 RepID=UPI001FB175EF|nr:uncharacterized protein LOC124924980 [Impatiens glandulifera]